MSSLALTLQTRTFRSLRRHHNYRLFFAGQVVSLAGTWMQNVALAWLVIELSGSPLAVGALAFCRFLPFTVLVPLAGVAVDRIEPRRLVMATQASAMVVSIALAAVTLANVDSLPVVLALATLGGVTLALDAPGRQTLTFQMVGSRELPNAVALNAGLFNASRVLGPAIAGLVIATLGTGLCFVVNAISFLAVLAALALMRAEELVPLERAAGAGLVDGLREGIAWAARDPRTRVVLVVVTILSLFGFNFHVLVPLLASNALHVGPEGFGLLSAAFGAGALVGALAAASRRTASSNVFLAGTGGFSVLLVALALLHEPLLAGVVLFALGISFSSLTTSANASVQLAAPDRLRGRLVALYLFAFAGLTPLGGLIAGGLAEIGGTTLAFGVAGIAGLAATLWARPRLARAE